MLPPSLLLAALPLVGASKTVLGVPPVLQSKYTPSGSTWKCLDGSKEILWSAVNNDYCDCPDGSDEPGTSACPTSKFYCANVGHVGGTIPSSRVNDGLCEPECCDGSDEAEGVCPNVCKEVGEKYRAEQEAERKLRKTGSKIRASYISFAHKEKKRLQELVTSLSSKINDKEKEVERLRDVAERTESISAAALEHKKQSPLYASLITHSNALKSLQREHKKLQEREKALGDILNTLRSGYNPNYQDMAVLEAVRGWEQLAGLPHIGVEEDAILEAEKKGEEIAKAAEEEASKHAEDEWSADKLNRDLDGLLRTDYVSLLIEHDEHIDAPSSESPLFDLASYLPDSLVPHYEDVKDTLLTWLENLGIVHGQSDAAADTTHARQALTNAENELRKIVKEKEDAEGDIEEIFSVEGFGAEGEWKKLDGTCLEHNAGDYIYEACLFNEAKQKPVNGGASFSLGKFKSWNPSPDVKPGQPEFYMKQVYSGGTRCWNGPERSVVFELSCGTENAITAVAELEKCEYQFTGTSPALCLPLDSTGKRDEL